MNQTSKDLLGISLIALFMTIYLTGLYMYSANIYQATAISVSIFGFAGAIFSAGAAAMLMLKR